MPSPASSCILLGKSLEQSGWNRISKIMFSAITLLFVFSGFFRGFDITVMKQVGMAVPQWLTDLHAFFGYEVK